MAETITLALSITSQEVGRLVSLPLEVGKLSRVPT